VGAQLLERGVVAVRGLEAYDSASSIHASCLSVRLETIRKFDAYTCRTVEQHLGPHSTHLDRTQLVFKSK
jgi:hypothetical protein